MEEKQCIDCNQLKPISEFYQKGEGKYRAVCKDCYRKRYSKSWKKYYQKHKDEILLRVRKYYIANRDRILERYKKWCKTEKAKKIIREKEKKRRRRWLQKVRCRELFHYYLKTGKIKRGVCEICGSEEVEAHHDDYSKPLQVRWLCPKHHREIEGRTVGLEV